MATAAHPRPRKRRQEDECPLSNREREVVRLAMRGLTYQEIADQLVIGKTTVSTTMHNAYRRVGLAGRGGCRGRLFSLMLAKGWAFPDDLLPDYTGRGYTTLAPALRREAWLPSPAERLYLDAFDELLERRGIRGEEDTDAYLDAMYRARRVARPASRGRDVDAMFRSLGAAICTPEQKRLLRHF